MTNTIAEQFLFNQPTGYIRQAQVTHIQTLEIVEAKLFTCWMPLLSPTNSIQALKEVIQRIVIKEKHINNTHEQQYFKLNTMQIRITHN